MKIHIDKNKEQWKDSLMQIIGLSKPTTVYVIQAWFELDDDEKKVFNQNPELKDYILFENFLDPNDVFQYTYDLVTSEKWIKKGGWRFVAKSTNDWFRLEKEIYSAAERLKSQLLALDNSEGSSVIEI